MRNFKTPQEITQYFTRVRALLDAMYDDALKAVMGRGNPSYTRIKRIREVTGTRSMGEAHTKIVELRSALDQMEAQARISYLMDS